MRTFLIIVVIIGLASVAATIIVGLRSFDGTVVKEPYETGLRFDAARKEREASGWHVTMDRDRIPVGRGTLKLRISDREGKALADAEVTVSMSLLTTDRYDREYSAQTSGSGVCVFPIDIPKAGPWSVRITVTDQGTSIQFEEMLTAE